MKTYRSGWIAQHTGLSRRTMEDYVRRGYIHPRTDSRTNNYREYTWADIELAWRIKQLIRIGYYSIPRYSPLCQSMLYFSILWQQA